MGKSRRDRCEDREAPPPPPRSGNAVVRYILTILVVMVILYVGAFLMMRTDCFRAYVQDRLGARLGLPIRVKKVACDPALNLAAEVVYTEGIERRGAAGIRIGRLELEWDLVGLLRRGGALIRSVRAEECYLAFAPDGAGGWNPAVFTDLAGQLAEWGGFQVEAPSRSPPKADVETPAPAMPTNSIERLEWSACEFAAVTGRVVWWGMDSNALAVADGVNLAVTPVALPNRKMTHYFLTIREALTPNGTRLPDIRFEMLDTAGQKILLGLQGNWPTGVTAGTIATP